MELQNANMRLYGGAQYHRAMAEFRLIVGKLKCQTISREEIVNACGVEDIHDGTNYVRLTISIIMSSSLAILSKFSVVTYYFNLCRAACVIATSKARDVFEPLLQQVFFSSLAKEKPILKTQHVVILGYSNVKSMRLMRRNLR